MTRTAADIQAEIDALEKASHERVDAVLKRVGERPEVPWPGQDDGAIEIINASMRQVLAERAVIEPLRAEHARLVRAELEEATPVVLRDLASRLRAAYYAAGGTLFGGADHAWEALETKEAAAWAAVAQEAGRG